MWSVYSCLDELPTNKRDKSRTQHSCCVFYVRETTDDEFQTKRTSFLSSLDHGGYLNTLYEFCLGSQRKLCNGLCNVFKQICFSESSPRLPFNLCVVLVETLDETSSVYIGFDPTGNVKDLLVKSDINIL